MKTPERKDVCLPSQGKIPKKGILLRRVHTIDGIAVTSFQPFKLKLPILKTLAQVHFQGTSVEAKSKKLILHQTEELVGVGGP